MVTMGMRAIRATAAARSPSMKALSMPPWMMDSWLQCRGRMKKASSAPSSTLRSKNGPLWDENGPRYRMGVNPSGGAGTGLASSMPEDPALDHVPGLDVQDRCLAAVDLQHAADRAARRDRGLVHGDGVAGDAQHMAVGRDEQHVERDQRVLHP